MIIKRQIFEINVMIRWNKNLKILFSSKKNHMTKNEM
jgi:hypothetical protein